MAFSVLVLHGPNLASLAAEEIDPSLEARAEALGATLTIVCANGEEGLLNALHAAADEVDAVVVNPGVLAPAAFALAEGLEQLGLPTVEVLLEVLAPARGPSALAGVVKHHVHGMGVEGYLRALEQLVPEGLHKSGEDDEEARGTTARKPRHPAAAPPRTGKSIGRKTAAPAAAEAASARGKTIGRGAPEKKLSGPAVGRGTLTRAQVRTRIQARLQGKETPEGLAQWARETWTGIQRGAECEPNAKDTIENVLLTLMAGAKASEPVLVSQMAKLDP